MDTPWVLQATPYGGRGVFAKQSIPQGTLLHSCYSPYASVIYRAFRKEVCAECFAYAFDSNRNAWNIKFEAGNGVWFCREDCRKLWASERNVGGLLGLLNTVIDKMAHGMKRTKLKHGEAAFSATFHEEISLESLDLAWKNAEKIMITKEGKFRQDTVQLDDFELDTARFVVSAIVKRYIEDNSPHDLPQNATQLLRIASRWSEFLELQDNELLNIRSHPNILDSHLRIYAFLRTVLPTVLQVYVATSDTVRAIFARDQGNTFGVWDSSSEDDGEMLGWGMYVSGSYFNHDCAPNVRKMRVGRTMHFYTTRDIDQGEELCINYIDIQDAVRKRRGQLRDNWFFDCVCKRCEAELATGSYSNHLNDNYNW